MGARGGGNNAEGIAAGGGSIVNQSMGSIIGSTLLADAPNGDATRAGNGILIDDSNGGNAVAATTVQNDGLIQGKSGFGIKMVGNFADTITNTQRGVIRGAGTGATIQMGGGNDTLVNHGSIISDIGNAIDMEGGDDTWSSASPRDRASAPRWSSAIFRAAQERTPSGSSTAVAIKMSSPMPACCRTSRRCR